MVRHPRPATGLTEQDAIAFNESMARRDGIDRIDADGTVHLPPRAATRSPASVTDAGRSADDSAMRTAGLDAVLA